MLNFIPWPSNIIFLLCMHVLEKRKKIRFQAGKEMPEEKGKYLSLEIFPAPVQSSIPSPIAVQDVPAERSVLLGPGPVTCPPGSMSLALLPSQSCQSTNQVLFLLGWFSAVPPCRCGTAPVIVAGSRGDGVVSAPRMSCPEVTWLRSLGGEVATCGLHPVEETVREAQGWRL